ncbi:hypothetical protein BD779DRAFT_1785402 [Infundibulicybe gibba]|nr:hypothetical protein BD779DRAFT_1785402 [Infundibulicybe gibba]
MPRLARAVRSGDHIEIAPAEGNARRQANACTSPPRAFPLPSVHFYSGEFDGSCAAEAGSIRNEMSGYVDESMDARLESKKTRSAWNLLPVGNASLEARSGLARSAADSVPKRTLLAVGIKYARLLWLYGWAALMRNVGAFGQIVGVVEAGGILPVVYLTIVVIEPTWTRQRRISDSMRLDGGGLLTSYTWTGSSTRLRPAGLDHGNGGTVQTAESSSSHSQRVWIHRCPAAQPMRLHAHSVFTRAGTIIKCTQDTTSRCNRHAEQMNRSDFPHTTSVQPDVVSDGFPLLATAGAPPNMGSGEVDWNVTTPRGYEGKSKVKVFVFKE